MSVRAVMVFDTDSYAAWGIHLADTLPDDWQVRLVALSGYVEPSDRQLDNAVAGTRFARDDIQRMSAAQITGRLRLDAPDVLLLAVRGHVVPFLVTPYVGKRERPVIVTGFPGIALPPQDYDFHHRRPTDLWIVHSHNERRALSEIAATRSLTLEFGLATLPLLAEAVPHVETDAGEIVFATQALVPANDADRIAILDRFGEAASAHPGLTYVVKTRSVSGEAETHRRATPYDELLTQLSPPGNLLVSAGPMRDHLVHAAGLVTVSSTAALEAVAHDVPAIVLTDFGVSDELINTPFDGSGLFGTLDDVVAGAFKRADPAWLEDNYFHDTGENDWVRKIEQLLELRTGSGLPRLGKTKSGLLNGFYYRHDATAPWQGGFAAPIERRALSFARWLNQRRNRA